MEDVWKVIISCGTLIVTLILAIIIYYLVDIKHDLGNILAVLTVGYFIGIIAGSVVATDYDDL